MAPNKFSAASQTVVVLLIIFVSYLFWSVAGRPAHVAIGQLIAKPYLQLGSNGGLAILWQVSGANGDEWKFETFESGAWKSGPSVSKRLVEVDSLDPFELCSVDVTGFGTRAFEYRILKNGSVIFSAQANARLQSPSNFTFAVMGDCGADTTAQRKIAYWISQAKPNFILITGDIVYDCGRASEYLHHFFPIYNNDRLSPAQGAPILRSTLMAAVPGNHDTGRATLVDVRNLALLPDTLAYFYEWMQPLNGPGKDGEINTPVLLYDRSRQERFRKAAGKNYPAMATFYFDLGDARFIMLDANHYMNWTNPRWRAWLDGALADAKNKTWRFVLYHETAFNSDTSHFAEQRMRLISDILEKHDVRIVFCGHVHNYQRTYPLHFRVGGMQKGMVDGQLDVDKNGAPPNPDQIVYITSGAGGAHLSGGKISLQPNQWQPFTEKFIANIHSFTLCQVNGNELNGRQISEDGTELDNFHVSATSNPSHASNNYVNPVAPDPVLSK